MTNDSYPIYANTNTNENGAQGDTSSPNLRGGIRYIHTEGVDDSSHGSYDHSAHLLIED